MKTRFNAPALILQTCDFKERILVNIKNTEKIHMLFCDRLGGLSNISKVNMNHDI